MTYRLSLLDKSPIAEGEHAHQALARTLTLARHAESWGYHRYWIAEHHNTDNLASPSPEIVIAWLLAATSHIRIGSGGVMLQHYSPYKVAENFNLLASLAPGRVDLGVGKAPGGLPLSTRALQQGVNPQEKGDFAQQLEQLTGWLTPDLTDTASREETLLATPLPEQPARRFLLGASVESARLASRHDWDFVFAAHLNGDAALRHEVLSSWKQASERDTIVAVQVIVAPTAERAAALAETVQLWGVELENGQKVTVASEAQAHAFVRQSGSRARSILRRAPSLLSGTAPQVHDKLRQLQQESGIDEFIIDTPVADGDARLDSLRLLAEHHLTGRDSP